MLISLTDLTRSLHDPVNALNIPNSQAIAQIGAMVITQ